MEPTAPIDTHASGQIVARNTAALGASELLARGLAAVATIYLARALGVTAYGVLGVALAVIAYFNTIVNWGIELFGPREVAGDRAHLEAILPSVIAARLGTAVLLAALAFFGGHWLLPAEEAAVLVLFALLLLATALDARWAHLGLEKTGRIAIARTLAELIKLGLIVWWVRGPETVMRVPIAYFVGELTASLLLTWWLKQRGVRFHWRIEWPVVRRIYRQSLPLMLTTVMGMWVYNADVLYLRAFRDNVEVGVYLAAYTLINFLAILGNTSRLSLVPTLTRLTDEAAARVQLYQSVLGQLVALGLPVAVGGSLLAGGIIRLLFGPDYAASAPALSILLWSVPFLLVRGVFQAALVAAGQQNRVFQMTAWATLLSVGLNLALVPQFGFLACATVTVTTEVVRMALGQWFVRRAGFPLVTVWRWWRPALATAVMGGVLLVMGRPSIWLGVPVGGLVYVGVLLAVGGLVIRRGKLPMIKA